MALRFGSLYAVRRGYTKHQLVSWLDEQERKVDLIPFEQSYWDYLPDMIQDYILKLAEDQLILEEKEKHKNLMKQVGFQIKAHRLWKAFYKFSAFGNNCGNCGVTISPEFSFRRHRARCFLNGRTVTINEGGDPVEEEETDEEELDKKEWETQEDFHLYLENNDNIAEDWKDLFSQYAHVSKVDDEDEDYYDDDDDYSYEFDDDGADWWYP